MRCKYRKIALICIFLLFKTTGRIYMYIFILIITQVSVAIIFMAVINGCFYDSWGSDAWRFKNVLSSVLILMLTYQLLCSAHEKIFLTFFNAFLCGKWYIKLIMTRYSIIQKLNGLNVQPGVSNTNKKSVSVTHCPWFHKIPSFLLSS